MLLVLRVTDEFLDAIRIRTRYLGVHVDCSNPWGSRCMHALHLYKAKKKSPLVVRQRPPCTGQIFQQLNIIRMCGLCLDAFVAIVCTTWEFGKSYLIDNFPVWKSIYDFQIQVNAICESFNRVVVISMSNYSFPIRFPVLELWHSEQAYGIESVTNRNVAPTSVFDFYPH